MMRTTFFADRQYLGIRSITERIRKNYLKKEFPDRLFLRQLQLLNNFFFVDSFGVMRVDLSVFLSIFSFLIRPILNRNILDMFRKAPIRYQNHVETKVAIQIFRIVFQEELRYVAYSSQLLRSNRDLAFFLAFSGFNLDK